ncbi:flagellin N-terminal helical domain-containing protein [Heyndrickxia sp. FSL W8-0423]|uniref:flagellin N-terminal helical domain-containing protein n=1 Tax=Heyndrickxia sp. FSL W8-0423 TaxID=2921601 RepID=UPI0030F5964E
MQINHNIAALNTYNKLNAASNAQSKSMEKLSSGMRINRAGDDAAGLAISEKMRGQIRGLDMASKNAQDGISLIQTAEGALNETHDILQRMRELAVQSSNDTNTDADRNEIQKEVSQLKDEIGRIANTTEFNTKKLLNGDLEGAKTAQGTELKSVELNAAGAAATDATLLTDLTDANGNSLGLKSGDVIKINAKINGTAQSETTVTIADDTDVDALLTAIGSIAGGTATIEADGTLKVVGADGTAGAISDLKLSVDDRQLFNNKFSNFKETQAALDTNVDSALSFQIGANEGQTMKVDINRMDVQALSLQSVDLSTEQGAQTSISVINSAIEKVSTERSKLGAFQNRLDHTINNLGTSSENLTAAESRIRDVDYALAA